MEKETKTHIKTVIKQELEYFYSNHISKLKSLKLHTLFKRKNVFLLAALNQPPEKIVADTVMAFGTASMETVFGNTLQKILTKLFERTYDVAMTSSGKSIDIDVVTPKARLTLDLKSGASTHNSSSESCARTQMKKASSRLRMQPLPVWPLYATCYGRAKMRFDADKLKVQGQTLWYIASKDRNCYKEIIHMFTRSTKTVRRKLETATSAVLESLTEQFKREFCTGGIEVDWGKLAELSCENLSPETENVLKEKIIG